MQQLFGIKKTSKTTNQKVEHLHVSHKATTLSSPITKFSINQTVALSQKAV